MQILHEGKVLVRKSPDTLTLFYTGSVKDFPSTFHDLMEDGLVRSKKDMNGKQYLVLEGDNGYMIAHPNTLILYKCAGMHNRKFHFFNIISDLYYDETSTNNKDSACGN